MKKGESIHRYIKEGICVFKWKDKRDIPVISSEFPYTICEVSSKGAIKQKTIVVKKNNENMSRINRQDQMSSYYPCEWKTLRWYKKIDVHFTHLLLVNSYFLYNKHVKKTSLYNCRLSVIGLLPKKENNTPTNSQKKKRTEIHLPKKSRKNQYFKKRCKVCADRKIHKETYLFLWPMWWSMRIVLRNMFQKISQTKNIIWSYSVHFFFWLPIDDYILSNE